MAIETTVKEVPAESKLDRFPALVRNKKTGLVILTFKPSSGVVVVGDGLQKVGSFSTTWLSPIDYPDTMEYLPVGTELTIKVTA